MCEEIIDVENTNSSEQKATSSKFNVFGYSIWRILAYFFIYSFLGFIMETIFALLTKGVIESRKSMLYGPLCCIYGLGAVFLICVPKSIRNNNYKLFLYGMIMGSAVEYVVSWVGDSIFNMKWWDYSNYPFNINGRICLLFAVVWGLCTLGLNKLFNPTVDKFIDFIKTKFSAKSLHIFLVVFALIIIADNMISSFALKMFYTRLIRDYKIENVAGVESYYEKYILLYDNNTFVRVTTDKFFDNKTLVLAFPNLKLTLKNGDAIWIRDILTDIQPYYIKVFEPKDNLFYSKDE